MSERQYENARDTLLLYDTHYAMLKDVINRAEKNDPAIDKVFSSMATTDMSFKRAAYVLGEIGYKKESERMLALFTKKAKIVPPLFKLSTEPANVGDMSLFKGPPRVPPLLKTKDIPYPSSEEIKEAIENMEELTVETIRRIDALLCDAKPKPYFPKIVVCLKAIEMYMP